MKRTVREYLADLEQENPVEEPAPQQDQVSTTDPDSTYSTKGARPAELGYFNNYLIDNQSCVILGVQATSARLSQESAAAREMITRSAERRGRFPQSVAADTTYGNGELLAWFEERNITPYIRVQESLLPKPTCTGSRSSPTLPRRTAINVRKESGSPTLASMPSIERMCTWPRGSAVAIARKKRNAPGATIGRSRSMSTNRRDNGRASGRPCRPSQQRNANAGK